ncbi:MAG TPA: isoaspartyl peptidase/L-asparaginase [Candidatus Thermoplasmatota archaeon]|nr:isoaspartyl peptidase/L-asparaginase [Candidatus Thermoplasmatota archaeon]
MDTWLCDAAKHVGPAPRLYWTGCFGRVLPTGTPEGTRRDPITQFAVAHGGAASSSMDRDGPEAACRLALDAMARGGSPLQAAVAGCSLLEDDPRFNAGTGSNLRLDGKTIEMDASCMTSDGKYGAVACIRDVRNPVQVAALVHSTPHNLLVGEGAIAFARAHGHTPYDPFTPEARRRYDEVRKVLRLAKVQAEEYAWDMTSLALNWNYPQDIKSMLGDSDTVGVLTTDGRTFAAASSTGGTISTLLGRVGDVPLIGCGIYAGPKGAVAVTGAGDFLARQMLSRRIYVELESGRELPAVLEEAVHLFPDYVDVGAIALFGPQWAGHSNRDMAWAAARGGP